MRRKSLANSGAIEERARIFSAFCKRSSAGSIIAYSTARAALRVPIFLLFLGGLGLLVEFLGPYPELRPCRFGSRTADHFAALPRHPSEELCAHGGRPA
jgi:hypothetical protein